jgi:hypothetical protein
MKSLRSDIIETLLNHPELSYLNQHHNKIWRKVTLSHYDLEEHEQIQKREYPYPIDWKEVLLFMDFIDDECEGWRSYFSPAYDAPEDSKFLYSYNNAGYKETSDYEEMAYKVILEATCRGLLSVIMILTHDPILIKSAVSEMYVHEHYTLGLNNVIGTKYEPSDNSIINAGGNEVANSAIVLFFDDIKNKEMQWKGFNLLYHLSVSSSCELCASENLNMIWIFLQRAAHESHLKGELIDPDLMDMLLQMITYRGQKYQDDETGFDGYWLLSLENPLSVLREYYFPYLEKILDNSVLLPALYVSPEKARVVLVEFLRRNRRRIEIGTTISQLAVRRNPKWCPLTGESQNIAAAWLKEIKVKYPNSPTVQAIFDNEEEKGEEKGGEKKEEKGEEKGGEKKEDKKEEKGGEKGGEKKEEKGEEKGGEKKEETCVEKKEEK